MLWLFVTFLVYSSKGRLDLSRFVGPGVAGARGSEQKFWMITVMGSVCRVSCKWAAGVRLG